jgi:predicted phage-related endonuclease
MILDKIKPQTKAWHEQRALGVGASESPALFGVQAPYAPSLFALAMIKRGTIPPPVVDSPLARLGLLKEPGIAAYHAEDRGWKIKRVGYAVDDKVPQMRASLDFVIAEPTDEDRKVLGRDVDGPGVLQIKTVIHWQAQERWIQGQPPEYVLIQIQQEMHCTGYRWAAVGAELGGLPRLTLHRRNEAAGTRLREAIKTFWKSNVVKGIDPPTDDTDSTREALRDLQPPREMRDGMINKERDKELNEAAHMLDIARADMIESEARVLGAENRLVHLMGMNLHAYTKDYFIDRSVTPKQRRLRVARRIVRGDS